MRIPELWGGAECTVNRVGDRFGDQLVATGHDARAEDIDALATLGLAAVRFPVLWERVSPDRPDVQDWRWSDDRLARLRAFDIRPIVGLIHHGSGPAYTSLLDDGFAEGLASHALAVARRYPWVEDWTPVNEPLTTARFSALYGHWYPHARDERLFWVALLNQVEGVRLSMRAIRSVRPDARLIQTDDLGRTYSTPAVAAQASFDNARRWMTWDLLCGRVVPGHTFWERLCGYGLEARLRALVDDPCPPDVIGINHYLTSDRFLDHRLDRYPEHARGGNGRSHYADVEAVRVLDPPPPGFRGAIDEAWERYRLPLALTEVHNGCSREEQLRWLNGAWQAAGDAAAAGIDLRAVTVWALFGGCGWNTLLTSTGDYEAGAFDISGGHPRPTSVAALARSLAGKGPPPPALGGAGWWRRDVRLAHPRVARPAPIREHLAATASPAPVPPILILGGTGTLGNALAGACRLRDIASVLTSRRELDLADPASVAAALDRHRPWAVINAAGWVRVDDAEAEPESCMRVNADAAVALARACADRGIATLSFSSDLVFEGSAGRAYLERDRPRPLNVYGSSKAAMEEGIRALAGNHLIVRTAAFFSPWDGANFAVHASRTLARGERFAAACDQAVTPTYVPDLCRASLDLLIDEADGIWHLSNGETLTWAAFAVRVAGACGLDPALIEHVPGAALGWRAPRPSSCGLASERGALMPSLQTALARFAAELRAERERDAGATAATGWALAA